MARSKRVQHKVTKLFGLTQEQRRAVLDAQHEIAKGEPGLYVAVSGSVGRICGELVEGECGTYVEIKQSGGTRGVHDHRPCEWSDTYFVPNDYALQLAGSK